MYDYTDKVIAFLNKRFVELFGSVKNLRRAEESDIFKHVNAQYRIGELEKKVDKHNNLVERTYRLEEKMKTANHRIDDLESAAKN